MLNLVGEIGKEITVDGVAAWLEANASKPFDVLLDSPGGDMMAAMQIDAMLQAAPVRQVITKQASSAASFILLGQRNRKLHPDVASDDEVMVIHNPHISRLHVKKAEADDLREFAKQLDYYTDVLATRYSDALGLPIEQAKKLMKTETRLSRDEVKRLNVLAFAPQKPKTNMSIFQDAISKLQEATGLLGKINARASDGEVELEISKEGEDNLADEIARLKAENEMLKQSLDAKAMEADQYKAKCEAMEKEKAADAGAIKEMEAKVDALVAEVKAVAEKQSKLDVQAKASPKVKVVDATPAENEPLWKMQERLRKGEFV